MTKGRPSGSLSIHPAVDFPSPAHSVAFYDVKRHIFGFAAGGAGTDLLPSAPFAAIIKMPFLRVAGVAQVVRASGCGPEGRGFESRRSPQTLFCLFQ